MFTASVTAGLIGLFGSFVYVVLYTMWTKRRYTLNTVVGSFSGAVPPLIGWDHRSKFTCHCMGIIYHYVYLANTPLLALAMKKSEDYRNAGVPMLPVVYGFDTTKKQIMVWIACLLPLPFYLMSLGIPFVILATVLNIGWLVVGFVGFNKKDPMKWATRMFVYSLNYLTILFVGMIIATLI